MSRDNIVVEQEDGTFQFKDGRRVFPFTCPACEHEAYAAKSLMMEDFARNSGSATCSQCGQWLRLHMIPDLNGDRMEATIPEQTVKLQ